MDRFFDITFVVVSSVFGLDGENTEFESQILADDEDVGCIIFLCFYMSYIEELEQIVYEGDHTFLLTNIFSMLIEYCSNWSEHVVSDSMVFFI